MEAVRLTKGIFFDTRKTMREILDKCPEKYFHVLIFLTGLTLTTGKHSPLLFALVLAWPFGYVLNAFWAFLVQKTGKWMKGQGTLRQLRVASLWGQIPSIISCIIGIAIVLPMTLIAGVFSLPILFIYFAGVIPIAIWSTYISLGALAEAQKYDSRWQAFGNALLAFLLFLGAIVGVSLLFGLLYGLRAYSSSH